MTYEDRPVSVTNPSHYRSHPSGVECIDVIRHTPFNIGNAVKYLWRAGDKGGPEKLREDLEKALWYIQDAIDNNERFFAGDVNGDLLDKWSEAEPPGRRQKAITQILSGRYHTSRITVEKWINDLDDVLDATA